jgi:DNA repair protein RecN (Recombination protein N)
LLDTGRSIRKDAQAVFGDEAVEKLQKQIARYRSWKNGTQLSANRTKAIPVIKKKY